MLRGRRSRRISLSVASALLAALATATSTPAAELKGFVYPCPEKQSLCYWHKVVVAPPKGWQENQSWSERYRSLVLFPNGQTSRSHPMLYIRAHHGDAEQSLEAYIKTAQDRWKQRLPDSTIEPRSDLERTGKPTIKLFLYRNPSVPDQPFELTAFMKDNNSAAGANPKDMYFFQGVLVAPSMQELDKATPAFLDVLRRL